MPEAEWKWVCQRPERALFMSTKKQKGVNGIKMNSVNALNGLFSFLQKNDKNF